jgi:hypothetical protein
LGWDICEGTVGGGGEVGSYSVWGEGGEIYYNSFILAMQSPISGPGIFRYEKMLLLLLLRYKPADLSFSTRQLIECTVLNSGISICHKVFSQFVNIYIPTVNLFVLARLSFSASTVHTYLLVS